LYRREHRHFRRRELGVAAAAPCTGRTLHPSDGERYPKAGADFGYNSASGDYYDRLRDVHAFSEQALFDITGRTIEIQGTPQRVTGMQATPSLFRLLRVSPAYGPPFPMPKASPAPIRKRF
jgi:hypothetical protein